MHTEIERRSGLLIWPPAATAINFVAHLEKHVAFTAKHTRNCSVTSASAVGTLVAHSSRHSKHDTARLAQWVRSHLTPVPMQGWPKAAKAAATALHRRFAAPQPARAVRRRCGLAALQALEARTPAPFQLRMTGALRKVWHHPTCCLLLWRWRATRIVARREGCILSRLKTIGGRIVSRLITMKSSSGNLGR